MLSIGDFEDMTRIQVDSPVGQSDLETIERTIALLKEVRPAPRTTVAGMTSTEFSAIYEALDEAADKSSSTTLWK
jgi:hypothetical protein